MTRKDKGIKDKKESTIGFWVMILLFGAYLIFKVIQIIGLLV